MLPKKGKGPLGYELIGGLKLLEAVLLAAAGFGIFRLLGKDLGAVWSITSRACTLIRTTGSSRSRSTGCPRSNLLVSRPSARARSSTP